MTKRGGEPAGEGTPVPLSRLVPAAGGGPLSSPSILVGAAICIGKLRFTAQYLGGQQEKTIAAIWRPGAEGELLAPKALADNFSDTPLGLTIPDAIGEFSLRLEEIRFAYGFEKSEFRFTIKAQEYGQFTIATRGEPAGRVFEFRLAINTPVAFSGLPVLGGAGGAGSLHLEYFMVSFSTGGSVNFGARILLRLPGREETVIEFPPPERLLASGNTAPDVKWFDINKSVGPVQLARLGFRMDGGRVEVFVDAGLRLSILLLEALGLWLAIPFSKGKSFGFGIQGLSVTVARPPLYISGGLYIAKENGMELYTGQLTVIIRKFQLTALGSYGKFADGSVSLFIFLMLGIPLGGPSSFFITGLAGGFGYNRNILLPSDVHAVQKFPFVAAAMGKGDLKADMSPAAVLKEMNTAIPPMEGQYFISAGIRFTSFGMVESFLLLNVCFGNRLEISLLGVSALSMPPKQDDPFVHLELALLAVIAPQDGLVDIRGALTSRSFLLHKDCKVTGGFAVVFWFGPHEHSGDFVITLGGYREGFLVPHYPQVDKLGISWQMSKELTLKGSFYFALTPACVMMGGRLAITYELGRLRAWFIAGMDLYLRWKPFLYDIKVYISVGASFRWDFFPFYRTFSIELGAELSLWGPPFGGQVRISWYIISFTISFGKGKPRPDPLTWNQFADSFLVKAAADGARELITARVSAGIVRERKEEKKRLCAAHFLELEIETQLPCSKVVLNSQTKEEEKENLPGVLPMGVSAFESCLEITVRRDGDNKLCTLLHEPIRKNLPRALWNAGNKQPGPLEEVLVKGKLVGLRLRCSRPGPAGRLPEKGSYSAGVLCGNERLKPHAFCWKTPAAVPARVRPGDGGLELIERTIGAPEARRRALGQLSVRFGVAPEEDVRLEGWTRGLPEVLLAMPELRTTGAAQPLA